MHSKVSELWRWDCGNVTKDDDGWQRRLLLSCSVNLLLWIYLLCSRVWLYVCQLQLYMCVCLCVCVRAPRQFNSSVTKTFCTAFDSCSFPNPLTSLSLPPPLTSIPLPSQSTGNAYWHHWLRQQAATPQNWVAAVAASRRFCLSVWSAIFFVRPLQLPSASTRHSLLRLLLQFLQFFSIFFLVQAETQLAKICVCTCVTVCVFA